MFNHISAIDAFKARAGLSILQSLLVVVYNNAWQMQNLSKTKGSLDYRYYHTASMSQQRLRILYDRAVGCSWAGVVTCSARCLTCRLSRSASCTTASSSWTATCAVNRLSPPRPPVLIPKISSSVGRSTTSCSKSRVQASMWNNTPWLVICQQALADLNHLFCKHGIAHCGIRW